MNSKITPPQKKMNVRKRQKERYVAPLYNFLINSGKEIRVDIVDRKDVVFCGVPEEYIDFLKSYTVLS